MGEEPRLEGGLETSMTESLGKLDWLDVPKVKVSDDPGIKLLFDPREEVSILILAVTVLV